jgi:hypothetical protein
MRQAIFVAGVNGEVICLDKSSYGNASISQPVTISCGDGLWESPLNQILINPPAGSDVVIEGLVGDGLGNNDATVVMSGQGTLHLRRVRMGNNPPSPGHAVFFKPNGPATILITDSVFYNNTGAGIMIQPTGSASVQAVITRTAFEKNNSGIVADGTMSTGKVQVQVNDSVIANNTTTGASAQSGSGLAVISLSNSQLTGNQTGIAASGSQAVIILDRTTVQANTGQALSSTGGSAIYSYGNNPINDNGALGTSPTVIGLH